MPNPTAGCRKHFTKSLQTHCAVSRILIQTPVQSALGRHYQERLGGRASQPHDSVVPGSCCSLNNF
jgi:hypothetical protein